VVLILVAQVVLVQMPILLGLLQQVLEFQVFMHQEVVVAVDTETVGHQLLLAVQPHQVAAEQAAQEAEALQ
jgi:hypothetical protein